MDNQNHSNQDCGCTDGCCTTQKSGNLWKRLSFIAIVLAAGLIITVKLIAKQSEPAAKCCNTSETPACCSQPKQDEKPAASCCTPAETPACCSQPAK